MPRDSTRRVQSVSQKQADASLDKIAEFAHQLTEGTDVDFIIAQQGILCISTERKLSVDVLNGWIGSQPAFNDFQRHLFDLQSGLTPSASSAQNGASLALMDIGSFDDVSQHEASLALNMHAALTLVGFDPRHGSVGGEIVLAHSSQTRSGYVSFSNFLSPPFRPEPNDQWNTIDFGNAANGGYSATTVLPKLLTYPSLWAIFRHQANEGRMLMADPLRARYFSKTRKASSAAHYCELLKQEHGVEFKHCGSHGH